MASFESIIEPVIMLVISILGSGSVWQVDFAHRLVG